MRRRSQALLTPKQNPSIYVIGTIFLGFGFFSWRKDRIRAELAKNGKVGEAVLLDKPSYCNQKQRWATVLFSGKEYDLKLTYQECVTYAVGEKINVIYSDKFTDSIYTHENLRKAELDLQISYALLIIGAVIIVVQLYRRYAN